MTESMQPTFTAGELNRLQHLKDSVLAFQGSIAPLAAEMRSDAHSEQFNQLRLEVKALLKDPDFDQEAPKAVTEEAWIAHSQKVIFPRLSAITLLGVILALIGLGINSIILEDVVVNSLGCCVSSGGMLLVFGAFGVWGLVNTRRRITNLGDLYVRCDTLLEQIDYTLNTAVPDLADRPAVDSAPIPSVVELSLDSLQKQAADWLQKLGELENQQLTLGPDAPIELAANIEFVQQELDQVNQEIGRLRGTTTAERRAVPSIVKSSVPSGARVIVPTGAQGVPVEKVNSQAVKRARSDTMDMLPLDVEQEAVPADEERPPSVTDETADDR